MRFFLHYLLPHPASLTSSAHMLSGITCVPWLICVSYFMILLDIVIPHYIKLGVTDGVVTHSVHCIDDGESLHSFLLLVNRDI